MSYHHGDLRAALIDASFDLLAECGLQKFSVAAVARRLGVSSAAPYRHFAGRDHLLSAVSAAAAAGLRAEIVAGAGGSLAAVAGIYVRYVMRTGAGFPVIYAADLYKIEDDQRREQTRALMATLLELAPASSYSDGVRQVESTIAVAHGYVSLLADGFFARHPTAVEDVAARATEAAQALQQGPCR